MLRTTGALFVITLVAAGLHSAGVGASGEHESAFGTALLYVSIVLPAIAAALSGFGAQREYVRNSERFRRMGAYLEILSGQVHAARDETELREAVMRLEQHLRSENEDWIDVMRFHPLELHA